MNIPNDLATSLRALAQQQPEPSLWPQLQASLLQLQPRRSWRQRLALPVALAAGLLLALAVAWQQHAPPAVLAQHPTAPRPLPATRPADHAGTPAATDDAGARIAALQRQSQVLEGWVGAARNSNSNADDVLAGSEIEDMIGLVDVQLAAGDSHTDTLPLWRQRVALLQDLAALRYTGATLAANGVSDAAISATPASWIN